MELKTAADLIPNQTVLINVLPLLEAPASTEVENIVTTNDELFRQAAMGEGRPDAATREALNYRSALMAGCSSLRQRPLCTATAVEVCGAIKNQQMQIRRVPGTRLANHWTGEVIHTPPEGEEVLRDKLSNWETFMHTHGELDPLVRKAEETPGRHPVPGTRAAARIFLLFGARVAHPAGQSSPSPPMKMTALRAPLWLPVLCAGISLTLPARARLGETEEQCIARYGQPVAETTGLLRGAKSVSFAKAGIRVRIEFVDDKAAFLSFSKYGLTQNDELQLLESNAASQVWSAAEDFAGRRCWMAPGEGEAEPRFATSYISGATTWLDIATKKWTDAISVQKAAMTAALPKPKPKDPAAGPASAAPASQPAKDPKKPGPLEGF